MEHKGTVMFKTKRLILRRFKISDLESYYRNCLSDHDVWKWSTYCPMTCIKDAVENEKFLPKNGLTNIKNLISITGQFN